MLDYLRLQRFKCFEDVTVQFGKLTILTGANSAGKSSLIQSLLLIQQECLILPYENRKISTNGSWVKLGRAQDVLCYWAKEDNIDIALGTIEEKSEKQFNWRLNYDRQSDKNEDLSEFNLQSNCKIDMFPWFKGDFSYIGADRIGPQVVYYQPEELSKVNHIGIRGENTAFFLNKYKDSLVKKSLILNPENKKSRTLAFQVNSWISDILHPVRISTNNVSDADIITVGIDNLLHDKGAKKTRPTNMGFGLSSCLPIVTAALMSVPDYVPETEKIIIIENPEIHLHPRSQSKLGSFLARAASSGLQIILETHSDHFLNGVRIAVKQGLIKPSDVSINYIDEDYSLNRLDIDEEGKIDNWPPGFFDQLENDLRELS